MDSSSDWRSRVAEALGPVEGVRSLGGSVWSFTANGRRGVVKIGPGSADEAEGLRRLGAVTGGPSVPDVLHCTGDLLVTEWIDSTRRSETHEERLGRELGALHSTTIDQWGGGSGWIGNCRVDSDRCSSGPEFYRSRLTDLARRCNLEELVVPLAERIGEMAPFGPPAPLHGDLWWGNVQWGTGGRPWLVDPSFHGGHPEEDLGMLALFGSIPSRLLGAYREVHPLDDGWTNRVALWQLYPLLVHTCLFGGGYRNQVVDIARRLGSTRG